jgi:hypothetical protein
VESGKVALGGMVCGKKALGLVALGKVVSTRMATSTKQVIAPINGQSKQQNNENIQITKVK